MTDIKKANVFITKLSKKPVIANKFDCQLVVHKLLNHSGYSAKCAGVIFGQYRLHIEDGLFSLNNRSGVAAKADYLHQLNDPEDNPVGYFFTNNTEWLDLENAKKEGYVCVSLKTNSMFIALPDNWLDRFGVNRFNLNYTKNGDRNSIGLTPLWEIGNQNWLLPYYMLPVLPSAEPVAFVIQGNHARYPDIVYLDNRTNYYRYTENSVEDTLAICNARQASLKATNFDTLLEWFRHHAPGYIKRSSIW